VTGTDTVTVTNVVSWKHKILGVLIFYRFGDAFKLFVFGCNCISGSQNVLLCIHLYLHKKTMNSDALTAVALRIRIL
jgi:hypothetical protein